MTFTRFLVLTCTALALTYGAVHVSNGALEQLQVPARALPVPTGVSPEMQRIIAASATEVAMWFHG
jgi:epsilon-lactone hydrolase